MDVSETAVNHPKEDAMQIASFFNTDYNFYNMGLRCKIVDFDKSSIIEVYNVSDEIIGYM